MYFNINVLIRPEQKYFGKTLDLTGNQRLFFQNTQNCLEYKMNNFDGEKPDNHKKIGTTVGTFCM